MKSRRSLASQIEDYIIKNKEKHYRLAYSYVKNKEEALDIVQESIYKAFAAMDTLNDPGNLKTWFYRITINTSLDSIRKRKKIVLVDEETLNDQDTSMVDKYENIDLRNALEQLPVQYRSVVVLRYFEDLKIEDIAAILNENVNTIKTRLYKALKMLKIKMDEID